MAFVRCNKNDVIFHKAYGDAYSLFVGMFLSLIKAIRQFLFCVFVIFCCCSVLQSKPDTQELISIFIKHVSAWYHIMVMMVSGVFSRCRHCIEGVQSHK